jgi:hypothetical protein
MPPAGFEPAIPAGDRLQILDLDHLATGIGQFLTKNKKKPTTQRYLPE